MVQMQSRHEYSSFLSSIDCVRTVSELAAASIDERRRCNCIHTAWPIVQLARACSRVESRELYWHNARCTSTSTCYTCWTCTCTCKHMGTRFRNDLSLVTAAAVPSGAATPPTASGAVRAGRSRLDRHEGIDSTLKAPPDLPHRVHSDLPG